LPRIDPVSFVQFCQEHGMQLPPNASLVPCLEVVTTATHVAWEGHAGLEHEQDAGEHLAVLLTVFMEFFTVQLLSCQNRHCFRMLLVFRGRYFGLGAHSMRYARVELDADPFAPAIAGTVCHCIVPLAAAAMIVLATLATACRAGEDTAMRSWLGACLSTQEVTDHVAFTGVTEETLTQEFAGRHPGAIRRLEFNVRRRGSWFDISGKDIVLGGSGSLSTKIRIIDSDQYVFTSSRLNDSKAGVRARFSKQTEARFAETVSDKWQQITSIDGYCLGSRGQRVAKLMLSSHAIEHVADESVEGTLCHLVRARTAEGKYQLWLAPIYGFLPLRAEYERGPDDLLNGTPLSQTTKLHPQERGPAIASIFWAATLEHVSVTKVQDRFVPSKGSLKTVRRFDNGAERTVVTRIERERIELKPNFEASDAFRPDIKEGTTVSNLDDPDSGLRYVWRDGTAMPQSLIFEGPTSEFSREQKSFGPTTSLLVGMAAVAGVALVFWYVVAKRRRGRSAAT
jgi:hypothetical protein